MPIGSWHLPTGWTLIEDVRRFVLTRQRARVGGAALRVGGAGLPCFGGELAW